MASRPPGVLKYDPSILNKAQGTIAGWFRLSILGGSSSHNYQALLTTSSAASPGPRLLIMREHAGADTNKLKVWDGDGSTEQVYSTTTLLQASTWYHFAFTWSPSEGRKLYLNGALEASVSRAVPIGGNELRVGYWRGDTDTLNGLLDELLILPYAASAEEIRSWYEAQAPFYHPSPIPIAL